MSCGSAVSLSQSRASPAIAKKTPSPTSTSGAACSAKVKQKPFVSPASPSSYRHIRAKVVSHQKQQQKQPCGPCHKLGNQSTISRISSDGSLSLSQGDMKDVSLASVSSINSVASSRSRQVAFASPKVMIRPGTGPGVKRGLHTPDNSRSRLNATPTGRGATGPRTPAKGSRANALGYKKTPGSVGSNSSNKSGAKTGGSKTATTAEDLNTRSYNKGLNLKPNDVLKLLTTIKSQELGSQDNQITLRELMPKDLHSEKPACSSNLMGAFNVFPGKALSHSHKHVDADQSVSSTCTLDQRLEELSMDEKLSQRLDTSILDENQPNPQPQPNYRVLMDRIRQQNEDFVEKYTQQARSIYFAQRKQLLDPNTVVTAEKSLNRLNDAVGKLSTSTTKEYKILRENMAYKGESIPCPFEERAHFVENLERYDKTMSYGQPALFPSTLVGDENQAHGKLDEIENLLGDQLSKLKLQLNQLETSNEKLTAQNERTAKSLVRYHECKDL